MNKYEEALKRIMLDGKCDTSKIDDKDLTLLLQLFKQSTPMKPINVEKDYAGLIGECPRCNWWCDSFSLNDGINYCQVCGQALDWSDEK